MRLTTRSSATWLVAGAAVLWTIALVSYLTGPVGARLVRVVPDDALFYLVLARNGAGGALSSFDGFERTNGYHPLWLLVLQPLALAFRGPDALVRAGFAVGLAAYAGAAAALFRGVRAWGGAPEVATAALAVLVLPASWLLTEAPVALLCCAWFLFELLGEDAGRDDRAARLALWGTLTVLARLDAVFLVVPALLARAWDRSSAGPGARAQAFAPLVGVGLGVLVYMAINVAVFGHPMPISGMIKGSFPHPVLPRFGALSRYVRALPPLVGALLWLGARAAGWRAPLSRAAGRALDAVLVGQLAFYAYELFFQKELAWGVASWHFALSNLLLAALIGLAAARLPGRGRVAIALVLLVLAGADLARKLRPGSPADTSLAPLAAAGLWLRDHAEPTAVVAATDPGLVAWLGERRTISLDGLVNTLAYQDVLRERRLAEYLRARDVGYVVVLGPYAAPPGRSLRVPIPSRLYAPAGDTLEVGAAPPVFTAPGGGVRVWRYPPAATAP